jgi:hypothetical protein
MPAPTSVASTAELALARDICADAAEVKVHAHRPMSPQAAVVRMVGSMQRVIRAD